MDNIGLLIRGTLLFLLGQSIVFYQINGQFLWEFAKKNPMIMSLFGIPISFIYIYATDYTVQAFSGSLWPQRLIGFAMGIIAFTFLTYFHLGETITLKTGITLLLALFIVLIQVFY
tara:strand:+ start:287 stop:634 length:348 start_codon:yes stop_codon:yes gene_type:complete